MVTFDSGVNSDIPASFVATNNRKAGAQAADALAEQVGQKGKVGIIAHVAGTTSAIERSEGFSERMKEKYPNIQVLPVQYSDGDPQKRWIKPLIWFRPTRISPVFMPPTKAQPWALRTLSTARI